MRFSTRYLPASERLPFWREVFGRHIVRLDVEPISDQPLEAEANLAALPGFGILWSSTSTPASWGRTPSLLADGNDDLALLISVAGEFTHSRRGEDCDIKPGCAVGILHNEPTGIRFRASEHIGLMVPRSALADLVSNLEDAAARPIPRETEALRLLRVYLAGLLQGGGIAEPSLAKLVATHLQDLVAVALGATRDGKQVAMARGVRAARVKAIKADFAANPSPSAAELAARQRVTPRYVQRLFEETGETFTDYAMEQRLTSAYRMLRDEQFRHLTIAAIAYRAGFGDLSHFNRNFRRRFGQTPTELRNGK